jgi:hypothetical protein
MVGPRKLKGACSGMKCALGLIKESHETILIFGDDNIVVVVNVIHLRSHLSLLISYREQLTVPDH